MVAAPTKPVTSLNCGQTSMQQQQTDAVGERVAGFLLLREYAGAGAEIVGAVDGDPGFDGHQIFKEHRAVDLEVADEGEFRERLYADGLFEIVNEGGAGHAGFAVDAHGAGAADFFEAIGIVGYGGGGAAVGGDGVGGDLHHGGDDVHAGTPFELEALPYGGSIGVGLALDFELYGSVCHGFLFRRFSRRPYWAPGPNLLSYPGFHPGLFSLRPLRGADATAKA